MNQVLFVPSHDLVLLLSCTTRVLYLNLQVDEGANGQLTKCLSDGVVVTDFDDHLDDTSSSFVIEL